MKMKGILQYNIVMMKTIFKCECQLEF